VAFDKGGRNNLPIVIDRHCWIEVERVCSCPNQLVKICHAAAFVAIIGIYLSMTQAASPPPLSTLPTNSARYFVALALVRTNACSNEQ
jgi:hypothetical protein